MEKISNNFVVVSPHEPQHLLLVLEFAAAFVRFSFAHAEIVPLQFALYTEGMENGGGEQITLDELARMMANGFAEIREQFAALESHVGDLDMRVGGAEAGLSRRIDNLRYKVDQVDLKLDQHRQETKDGFAALHGVVGGLSHTLTDHEERIKEMGGE